MKEISKKDLLLQLQESQEFDEMAVKSKGVQAQRTDPNTGEVKPPKFKPHWKEGNNSDIPDYWILNPTQTIGQDQLVVPLDCSELEQFINENREWLDSINLLHGLEPNLVACKRGKYHPRNSKVGTSYVPSGEKYDEKEQILRLFNPIIKKELTDNVNSHLVKCGLPPIQTYDNKEFVDKYAEVTNDRIDWESHDYDFYNTVIDFASAAKDLLTKGQTDIEIYRTHMPRQYNPGANWSALRKTEKSSYFIKNDPLTDTYKLPRRGYEADDKDVAISTTLHITGHLRGTQYEWTVDFKTQMGRKLKEESRVNSGSLLTDKSITTRQSIEFLGDVDNEKSVMSHEEIRNGLILCLNELAEKIMQINSKQELIKRIKIRQGDITKRPEMNESQVVSLIRDVIKNK